MKRLFLALTLCCVGVSAQAATAFWTGALRVGTSVTGQSGANCEYQYAGRTFWIFVVGLSCPAQIEIE